MLVLKAISDLTTKSRIKLVKFSIHVYLPIQNYTTL